jgi:Na+/proline symporter
MKKAVSTSAIVGLVLAGAALFGALAGIGRGENLGVTLFLGFIAVIIAFQVAPALMLFGVLLKEVFRPAAKEKAEVRVPTGDEK